MRCLYCGKQLPLLKKLTGGGEFCSETHRQKYQEEYNKLALSRLLQTQNSDGDSPSRGGDLVLSPRANALGGGLRGGMRALEAPKAEPVVASEPVSTSGNSFSTNSYPVPSHKQQPLPSLPPQRGGMRALPPPSLEPPPAISNDFPGDRSKPESMTSPLPGPSFANPTFSNKDGASDPALDRFREALQHPTGLTPPSAARTLGKRDAFSFRPMDGYPEPAPVRQPAPPVQKPAPQSDAPAGPEGEEPSIFLKPAAPVNLKPPSPVSPEHPPAPLASRVPVADPPEASFFLERTPVHPPPAAKGPAMEPYAQEAFTDGRPPGEAGGPSWDPGISVSGEFGAGELLPLPMETGPPWRLNTEGGEQEEGSKESDQRGQKGILESQVKPGEFNQAPERTHNGFQPALPVRPPAPGLEKMPFERHVELPSAPTLHQMGEFQAFGSGRTEIWAVRTGLDVVAPPDAAAVQGPVTHAEGSHSILAIAEVLAPEPTSESKLEMEPEPVSAISNGNVHNGAGNASPSTLNGWNNSRNAIASPAREPEVFARQSYTAESLKPASNQTASQTSAQTAARHEVFVDLSVLGIEEDEDADAESRAREGESPPGDGAPVERRRRRRVQVRERLTGLVEPAGPAAMAPGAKPGLDQGFRAIEFHSESSLHGPRLAGQPLRPKLVFASKPEPATQQVDRAQDPEKAEGKAPAPASSTTATAPAASRPAPLDWSARRLARKTDTPSRQATPEATPNVLAPVSAAAPVEVIPTAVPTKPAAADKATPVEEPKAIESKAAPAEPATHPGVGPLPHKQVGKDAKEVAVQQPDSAPPAGKMAGLRNKIDTAQSKASAAKSGPAPAPAKTQPAVAPTKKADPPVVKQAPEKIIEKPGVSQAPSETVPAKEGKRAAKDSAAAATTQAPGFEAPALSLAKQQGGLWRNLPVVPKLLLALMVFGGLGYFAWLNLKSAKSAGDGAVVKQQVSYSVGPNLMATPLSGWNPDWGGELNRKKGRTISFFRPSAGRDNYRLEFDGQIESKGLGWVVRAADAKNYYLYKIEFVKPGLVALGRAVVLNGDESARHYTPLTKPLRPGAVFHVRVDVRGDEFAIYINDELIESWHDDRIKQGGLGLMTEVGDGSQATKVQIFELTAVTGPAN